MVKRYSKELFEFVKANIQGTRIFEMAKMVNEKFGLNITDKQMKSYCNNHKLTNGLFHSSENIRPYTIFTEEQVQFVKDNYKGIGNQELSDLLNEKFNTSFTRGQIKRLKRRFALDSGLTGHFEKGHISANFGQAMSPEQYGKCKATMFKKGHKTYNKKPIGHEYVDAKDGYVHLKIKEPNIFVLKHRYIYEQANGPIPEGCIITFLDGNKQNCELSNLTMISLAENAVLNHLKLRSTDPVLNAAAINVAKIKTKIGKIERKK